MGLLLVVRWVQSGPPGTGRTSRPGLDMVPAEPVVTVVAEPPKSGAGRTDCRAPAAFDRHRVALVPRPGSRRDQQGECGLAQYLA